jgi:hypothetical protein
MHTWLSHHFDAIAAVGLMSVAALLAGAIRRWWLLAPAPLALAAAAWYGWEFSAEGAPLAGAIAVFLYAGLAIGAAVRRAARARG